MNIVMYIPSSLWIALGLSILTVLTLALIRRAFGRAILDIVVNVSFAIIASFIFFSVVDASKRMREYEAAGPYISRQIATMKGDVIALCREAAQSLGRELPPDWGFNYNEVAEIFKAAHLRSPANMVFISGKSAMIVDYMIDQARRTNESLINLLVFAFLLGGEATAQIADIQADSYLKQIQIISQFGDRQGDQNLSFILDAFDEHYSRIIRLEKWAGGNHLLVDPWKRP